MLRTWGGRTSSGCACCCFCWSSAKCCSSSQSAEEIRGSGFGGCCTEWASCQAVRLRSFLTHACCVKRYDHVATQPSMEMAEPREDCGLND